MGDPVVQESPGGHDAESLEQAGVPAMPVILPSEQVPGSPYPLLDGVSPTLGWQFGSKAKSDPVFVIVRRTGLGSLKIVESFPLTEGGWASAWQSLARQNPAAVPQVLAMLNAREASEKEKLAQEERRREAARRREEWKSRAADVVRFLGLGVMVYEGGVYSFGADPKPLGSLAGAHVEVVRGKTYKSAGRQVHDLVGNTIVFGLIGGPLVTAVSAAQYQGFIVFAFPDGSSLQIGLPNKPSLTRALTDAVRFNAMADAASGPARGPAEGSAEIGKGIAAELERLATLHASGALDDEEFRAAKARIIRGE